MPFCGDLMFTVWSWTINRIFYICHLITCACRLPLLLAFRCSSSRVRLLPLFGVPLGTSFGTSVALGPRRAEGVPHGRAFASFPFGFTMSRRRATASLHTSVWTHPLEELPIYLQAPQLHATIRSAYSPFPHTLLNNTKLVGLRACVLPCLHVCMYVAGAMFLFAGAAESNEFRV